MQSYKPPSAAENQAIMDRLLPPHEGYGRSNRVALTVLVLPPFSPDWQISLRHTHDGKCLVDLAVLSSRFSDTIADYLIAGGTNRDPAHLASLIGVRSIRFECTADETRNWAGRFWQSLELMGAQRPDRRLDLVTKTVSVYLDPTTYVVKYSDLDYDITVNLTGPDPERAQAIQAVDPVIRWALSFRDELERRQGRDVELRGRTGRPRPPADKAVAQ